MSDLFKEVDSLITRAEASHNARDALQYSQAALNAANALCVVAETPVRKNIVEPIEV